MPRPLITRRRTRLGRAATVLALVLAGAVGGHSADAAGHGAAAAGRSAGTPSAATNPFAGARLWADPGGDAALAAASIEATDPGGAAELVKIAQQPQAVWFGDWITTKQLSARVAQQVHIERAAGALPVLVIYDIPDRDCGGYSHGGAPTAAAYRAWVSAFADGVGQAPVAVILEPDALSHLTSCQLSPAGQSERLQLLSWAAWRITRQAGASLYLDAGSSGWHSAAVMAARLSSAGISYARGFALNTSDFKAQQDVIDFGHQLSALLGGRHFVTDTSRNGNGPPAATARSLWCNPAGRALGQRPTVHTGDPLVDAVLWVKHPGQSDGQCDEGDPPSGTWFTSYAIGLASLAHW